MHVIFIKICYYDSTYLRLARVMIHAVTMVAGASCDTVIIALTFALSFINYAGKYVHSIYVIT